MGLDLHGVQLLLRARKQGVQFGNVLTIGRLVLDVFPNKIQQLLQAHGLPDEKFRGGGPASGQTEDFFRSLGATSVQSLDASAYEGASVVHDLNLPISAEWKGRFDVVYDGGTLEHVFNFPVALRSCMEMVKVGGHLFLDSPGNNWFGHGFYQFSPELFYSACSEENGYEVVEMIAHPTGPQGRWYRVANPRVVRSRVELISYTLIHLMTHARRVAEREVFKQMPQQSDYTVAWQAGAPATQPLDRAAGPLVRFVGRRAPALAALLKAGKTGWNFYRSHSLRNRRFFVPISRD
ncbi:hypothetical protein SBV1_110028 [Verrucomicrobia bacterium]|nr:hypothetical protein SBV1_110028 [Verrucomicrobiota bacterium]